MSRIWTLIPFFLLLTVEISHAEEPLTDQQLRELMTELNHPSRSQRNNAEMELLKAGPEIIGRLKKLKSEFPDEESPDLTKVLRELHYRALVLQQGLPELELPASPLTLQQSIELIQSQIPHPLHLSSDVNLTTKTITFSETRLPYWATMIEILSQFHLDLTTDEGGREYILSPRQEMRTYLLPDQASPSASPDTAYRINRVVRKPIKGGEDFDLLRITFQVLSAPHRSPVFLRVSGDQILKTDLSDRANLLPPFSPESVTELPCQLGLISPEFRVDWMIPKSHHPENLGLQLKIEILEAVSRERFVFANWEKSHISQRKGLAVVTRDKVELSNDHLSVVLLILHSHRGAAFESHREWLSKTQIKLSQENQTLIPNRPTEKILEADGTTALKFTFDRPDSTLSDWTLQYELPTDFRTFHMSVPHRLPLKDWLKATQNKPTQLQ